MLSALLAALSIAVSPGDPLPLPVTFPSRDKTSIWRDGLPKLGDSTPAPRKKMFGLGVGFQARGTTQGISLDQVVAGAPADRSGFIAGTIITEINGESTLGRTGEDCTRMVREGGNSVTLKFYDPVTLRPRMRVVEKDWFPLPN